MIPSLYKPFKHWALNGSIYIISDTRFDDLNTKQIDADWVSSQEQVDIINKKVSKNDTLIHLGNVGNPAWMEKIKAGRKILITGNYDSAEKCKKGH